MKFRKLTAVLMAMTMVAALFTGCGSKTEQPAQTQEGQEAQSGEEKSGGDKADQEPITIQVMSGMMGEKVEGAIEQEIADDFMEKNPNIKIEFIPMSTNDVQKKIITLATGDSLPDVVGVQPTWLAQFEEMGIFEDLRPMMGEEYVNTYFEGALYEASVGDKILMFPWLCTPTALLYRADWFEEEGIQPPTNWDEFLEAAKKMTKDTDGDGKTDRWGFSMVGTRNNSGEARFVAMSRTWGVDEVIDNNGTWESGFTSPEFENFLTYFTDLNNEYGVVPPGAVETGYAEAVNYFSTEKTAMMITGSNAIGVIKSQNPEVGEKMASCMLPTGTTSCSATGIGGYAISATSEHKEEALEYLKFTLLPENILKFAEGTGRMPTQKDVMQDEMFNQEIFKGYVAMLDKPYKQPVFPGYVELLDVAGEAYSNIMGTGQSVEDAMKVVKEKTEAILAENNK